MPAPTLPETIDAILAGVVQVIKIVVENDGPMAVCHRLLDAGENLEKASQLLTRESEKQAAKPQET